MLRILDELFWVLRRDGFAISTAQAIDATRVAALVGFEDKATLRDALAAVVVERRADRSRFRTEFDEFFATGSAHRNDLWGRLRDRGFGDGELDALRQLLDAVAARSGTSGDAIDFLGLVGSESELDRVLLAAGIARTLRPMTSALQAGFYAQRLLTELRVPQAASALARIRSALAEALGHDRGGALADALGEELERVRRRVREHVDNTLRRNVAEASGGERKRLLYMPFTSLSETQIEEVRRAVRSLAERLRGAERVRRRRARTGSIDPHRTLRQSFHTGGVPFQPARRRRRRDRPRLLVLCDVSDSVRTASLFMLEFVYAAQELFAGTRSFVFVSEIAETTRLFDAEPIGAALAAVYGGTIVSRAHNSNYGRVLDTFEARHASAIDRRTTVVILGDGRTNYLPDEADVLGRLKERARAVLWLCPEGPATWGTGDSSMLHYAACVTKVLVARTAKELEAAAREVVARRK